MPTKKLTAKVLENLKPPKSGRLELWDTLIEGFGVRVTDKGSKSWFVMYRVNGPTGRKQRRLRLGDAGEGGLSLGEARDAARDALRLVARNIDPAQETGSRRGAVVDTVTTVAADYLDQYVKKNTRPSTHKETKRIFDVDVLPAWGARPIGDITRRDVTALLNVIADRGAEVQANRTLARLKTFFRWCVDEEIVSASPIGRMKPQTRESARDRALTDDEIRWFWEGCGALGWPFGPLFRLLLATAQRRDEVGTITFPELDVDGKLWIIPREKAKNDRAHEVSLSALALDVITGLRETRDKIDELKDCPLVFTTNGKTPVSGFSRAKERLDAEMEKLARKARGLPEKDDDLRKALKIKAGDELPRYVPEWILHDLRRTAATGMARLNIAPHVVDKVLNHVSGTIRGVAAVYNRFAYTDERRAALDAWGRYVAALVQPADGNADEMGETAHANAA